MHSIRTLVTCILTFSVTFASAYCSKLSLVYQESTRRIFATGLTGEPREIIGRWEIDTHMTGMRLTFMKDTLCCHYQFCNHSQTTTTTPSNSDMNFLQCSNGGQRIIFDELFIDPTSTAIERNLKDYASVDLDKILSDLQRFFNVDLLRRDDSNGSYKF